ncbi:HRDC domain-containing protein [Olivibacter sp. XZL3]|uniref:HRDC domain-containing protein n=1 Tax=Olivibacter sp. XZL3 TaxID=1735116 RepID=UPI001066F191|nr:HRDC domain-containing protein [Olivibacter sp. XZL3]
MNLHAVHKRIIDLLTKTDTPIFLTGKAGTGKTTFLRYIKSNLTKNIAVVAPTAIAALNAGGVTINSLFQIPFGPLIPQQNRNNLKGDMAVRMSPDKTKLFISLELLVIDEISMVRADVIDRIDFVLRAVKGSARPFGGVQLLMIGDLYQLPPVYQNDWPILKEYYGSPYFFSGRVFESVPLLSFELTEVFRQADPIFITILNSIRSAQIDESLLAVLNRQYKPEIAATELNEYVTLSTHNSSVAQINESRLRDLPGELMVYRARVVGDFPKDAYPADVELCLKVGAQIIFIKNDSSGKKQYYNGRAAQILNLAENSIRVRFLDDESEFDAVPETWENTKYALNESEGKIASSSSGSFTQYPIKLAWAITVHKSQGLTFDKAVIDVEAAFAHGQTYVALSRCRSLEGLVLKAPIKAENVITDARITDFMRRNIERTESEQKLAQLLLQQEYLVVADLFNFHNIEAEWGELKLLLKPSENEPMVAECVGQIEDVLGKQVSKVADKFLAKEFADLNREQALLSHIDFLARLKKAMSYFMPKIEVLLTQIQKLLVLPIDEEPDPAFFSIYNQLLMHLKGKFAAMRIELTDAWLRDLSAVTIEAAMNHFPVYQTKKAVAEPKPKEIANPLLLTEILAWRKEQSRKLDVPEYLILSEQLCITISAKAPKTLGDLAQVKGVGVGKAKELGDAFVKIIRHFYGEHDLFG